MYHKECEDFKTPPKCDKAKDMSLEVGEENIVTNKSSMMENSIRSHLTVIAKMLNTNFWDPSKASDLWNDYYYIIIGFIAILVIMTLVFFAYSYKDPNTEVGPVLKFILSAINFVLNTLFTAYYAQAVESVYIPSCVILIASSVLKEAFGLYLIRKERNNNSYFFNWWRKHITIGRIFTLLSFVDIYSLEILSSKIGDRESLSAPYSKSIKTWIYWIGFAALIKKDISQFVIQVIYYNSVLHYDLIPLLSLISATAVVLFNGIWRIYLIIRYCFSKLYRRNSDKADDEPIVIFNSENDS
ncbi:5956_t:CDS:2 [Cetraspora pellucida]|uniref:5956_t:CDS:1 n=1 Tax=Cetraspora pellucida TaxID=1433469 RepID=A0A9N8ZRX7_9GLOM|nr:5956_t:CDS:2 [Cetraspora pellucida]